MEPGHYSKSCTREVEYFISFTKKARLNESLISSSNKGSSTKLGSLKQGFFLLTDSETDLLLALTFIPYENTSPSFFDA